MLRQSYKALRRVGSKVLHRRGKAEVFKPKRLSRELQLGLFGTGKAARYHLYALRDIKGVTVDFVVNRGITDPSDIMEKYKISHHFDNVDDALRQRDIDGAIVAVSAKSTYEVAKSLLDREIDCLIEKPLGINLDQAETLKNLYRRKKMIALVGYNRRCYSSLLFAEELVEGLGRPYAVHVDAPENVVKLLSDKYEPDELENRLIWNTTHAIDILTMFGGSFDSIGEAGYAKCFNDVPVDYVNTVNFKNGMVGVFTSHWRSPGDWIVSIYGTGYKISINLSKNQAKLQSNGTTRHMGPNIYDRRFKAGVYLQNYRFLESIATGIPQYAPCPTVADACETMRLADAIKASVNTA